MDTLTQKQKDMFDRLSYKEAWKSLTVEEQKTLTRYTMGELWDQGNDNPESGDVFGNQSIFSFFSSFIGIAKLEKRWDLLDKLIFICDKNADESQSVIQLHFFYLNAADVYYIQRGFRDDAKDRTIYFCKKDIEIAELCIEEWTKQILVLEERTNSKPFLQLPYYPAFKQLAIIYEKSGNLDEAIRVCEKAIEIGFTDDKTKSGMSGRLDKLKTKLLRNK